MSSIQSRRGVKPRHLPELKLSNRMRRNLWGILFAMPAIILFAIFAAYPISQTFYYSFFRYDLVNMEYVGLQHYEQILTTPILRGSVLFTFQYVMVTYVPTLIIALALALSLNANIPGRSILRMVNFIPVVASWVIVAVIWKFMFHQNGLINVFLSSFGIDSVSWLLDEQTAPYAIIIPSIWKEVGFYMVIFLAGLQNIPRVYYEAARIDGASALQVFRYITVPLMRPTLVLASIISVIEGMKVFIPPFVMTQGGPAGATRVMALTIYQNAFAYNRLGRASAMAVVLFLVILLLTLAQRRLYGRDTQTN